MDVSFKTYETKFSTLAPLVDVYKFVPSSRGNQQKKDKKKLKKESLWDKVFKQYKEGKITKFEYVKQMSYKLF